ncbi:hypothetical protein BH11MYX3_BH11MYX3_19470 [soil metagenome]
MRYGLLLLLVSSACNTDVAEPTPASPASVRERLEDLTHLQVDATESGGAITAERHVAGGEWMGGLVDLQVENGELLVSSDAPGALTVDGMQITFKPLQIPPGVFGGKDAQLTHVRIDLKNELRAPARWVGDDEVHLAANLEINLSWELTLDGSPAPLGSPKLPLVPVEIVLTGNGEHVSAELRANAPGELWSWAGLVKLSELQLILGAKL